jgi:hypothetical protein
VSALGSCDHQTIRRPRPAMSDHSKCTRAQAWSQGPAGALHWQVRSGQVRSGVILERPEAGTMGEPQGSFGSSRAERCDTGALQTVESNFKGLKLRRYATVTRKAGALKNGPGQVQLRAHARPWHLKPLGRMKSSYLLAFAMLSSALLHT